MLMRKREKRDRERLMSAANCLNGFFFHALPGAPVFLWVLPVYVPARTPAQAVSICEFCAQHKTRRVKIIPRMYDFYTLDSVSVFWLNAVIGEELPPIIVLRNGGVV